MSEAAISSRSEAAVSGGKTPFFSAVSTSREDSPVAS